MATEHTADRTRISARKSGIVLGGLAVVVLAHPIYLWPQLGSDPGAYLLAGFARPVLTMLGGFLLTYAGLAAYRDEWRPVTPPTAVLFPVIVSLAVLVLQWYDETIHGLVGFHPINDNPVLVGAFSLLFMVGGSLVRRARTRAAVTFCLGCLLLFLVGVLIDQTRLPIALSSGVALGVAGVVIGGIGYVLTAPTSVGASR